MLDLRPFAVAGHGSYGLTAANSNAVVVKECVWLMTAALNSSDAAGSKAFFPAVGNVGSNGLAPGARDPERDLQVPSGRFIARGSTRGG
jgi:hypothetical protein